jgi:acyl-coenzyme A synthetase/AMP-(fatty) acid ligase
MISASQRAAMADDSELGAGNILHRLIGHGHSPDLELLWCDDQWHDPAGARPGVLTLGRLLDVVQTYAGYFHSVGVRPRDVVAVHTASATDNIIAFLALTSLGAIPSFVNARLRPDIAREYVRRQGAVGSFSDAERHVVLAGAGDPDPGLRFTARRSDIRPEHRDLAPGHPYRHHGSDPVLISHSSGTTGMPKGVPHTHESLFYAVRYRLRMPLGTSYDRGLSGLPGAHNATISTLLLFLALGNPLKLLTSQRGTEVLDAIESFRPTMVLGFSATFAEMAAHDLSTRDLSSVNVWYNTGDAAHEAHIRKLIAVGSHPEVTREHGRRSRPGSVFIDGLGSSEAGYALFHVNHQSDAATFGRCVGRPLPYVQAAILGEDGTELPPGTPGRLGVRSPSLTPGYWNDSLTNYRSRLSGYWLSGDLAYRDEQGRFYHLDRVPDAIRTPAGVIFSTYTEELLLRELPQLADATLVAVAPEGAGVGWEGEPVAQAYALLQTGPDWTVPADQVTDTVNAVLRAHDVPPVAEALVVADHEVAVGVTGKVLKRELRERFRRTETGAHAGAGVAQR